MENLDKLLPLKYRLILQCFLSAGPKTRLLNTFVIFLTVLYSLNLQVARAATATQVTVKAVANGNTILDRNVELPGGCQVSDTSGNSYDLPKSFVICALDAVTGDYRLIKGDGGLFLESIGGYVGKPNCVKPNCWLYSVNGKFAEFGVGGYLLKGGETIVFNYGEPTKNQPQVTEVKPAAPPVEQSAKPTTQPEPQKPAIQSKPTPLQRQLPPPAVDVKKVSRTPASSVTSGCIIRFSWAPYQGSPTIFYGSWNGAYYVFIFPVGSDRDHSVWESQILGLNAVAGGLAPGIIYEGEIFLHGAFISGSTPFWGKLAPTKCTPTNQVQPSG